MGIRTRNKVSVNFSMSSMTDIVFLLLIFFMLTSTLVSPNALKLLLPNSNSRTLAKQTISVSITQELQYYVGTDPVSIEDMSNILQAKIVGESDPSIVLHVDKTVPIEYAVKVMDIANNQKIRVVLATKPE
jgi:biopolymer transport protein ExbD